MATYCPHINYISLVLWSETFLNYFAELIQNKSKDGMKLKKKQKTKEQMEQEDQECEPPAAKKKKRNNKVTGDQENDHTDMNGNSSVETSPKKTKKNNGENTEVSVLFSFYSFKLNLRRTPLCHSHFHIPCKIVNTFIFVMEEDAKAKENGIGRSNKRAF